MSNLGVLELGVKGKSFVTREIITVEYRCVVRSSRLGNSSDFMELYFEDDEDQDVMGAIVAIAAWDGEYDARGEYEEYRTEKFPKEDLGGWYSVYSFFRSADTGEAVSSVIKHEEDEMVAYTIEGEQFWAGWATKPNTKLLQKLWFEELKGSVWKWYDLEESDDASEDSSVQSVPRS